MTRHTRIMVGLLALARVFLLSAGSQTTLSAAGPPAVVTNRVLQLDGTRSYLELPSGIFNGLREATVEGWMKWESFRYWSRFIDFGPYGQSMYVANVEGTSTLQLGWVRNLRASGLLAPGEWCHLAVVTGPGGTRLYFNGVLAAMSENPESLAEVGNAGHNYLGKSNWPGDEDLHGEMDEVRVWATERTAEQIRGNMFQRLTGWEPGLVGLWNFDDPDHPGRDATPHRFDGEMMGGSTVTPGSLPGATQLVVPFSVHGVVVDADGRSAFRADVRFEREGATLPGVEVDSAGRYFVVLPASDRPLTVSVKWGDLLSEFVTLPRSRDEHEVDFTVRDLASLSGRAVAWDENPLPTVVIQAVPASGGEIGLAQPGEPVVATTVTDARGRFRFPELAPGRYTLRAQVPGGFAEWEAGRILTVERDRPVSKLEFRLAPFKQGRWKTYSHQDGLAANQVYSLFQAADGAIWFGTDQGVSRFDGQAFANLTTADGLPGGPVLAIAETPAGVMWFGTLAGLVRRDARQPGQSATTFTARDGLAGDAVTSLAQDPAGNLWIGTGTGASRYDGNEFVSFTGPRHRVHNSGPGTHHGVLMGHARIVEIRRADPATLRPDTVLELDGDSGYAESAPLALDGNALTVTAWIRNDAEASPTATILHARGGVAETFGFHLDPSGTTLGYDI